LREEEEMYEHSNRMEGVSDVWDMISVLVARIQALRQKTVRLIRLMQEVGELPEEKAEGLRELIAGPLEEQEPGSAADVSSTALSMASAEAPLGAASGDARPRVPPRRRTARVARGPGAAQDLEDEGGRA
jgi:hypothetical protein